MTIRPSRFNKLYPGSASFTLIELMVVLAMIGLFAALVAPSIGNLGQAEMRATSRRLAGTIRFVYHMSILNKTPYRIAFDLDNQSYSIEERKGEEYTESKNDMLQSRVLPDSVYFRDVLVMDRLCDGLCVEYLYFTPYGFVEEATIHLTDEDGDVVYTLFTESMTGRTIILDEDFRREDYKPFEI